MSRTHVNCTINGDQVDFLSEAGGSLLNALRDDVGLMGVKEGCGTGDCGACSILVDDRVTCACLMFAPEAEGAPSSPSRAWPKPTASTRCSSVSSKAQRCNAACARRAFSWPPRRSSTRTRTRPRPKSAMHWRATYAGAPVTTRSSEPCSTQPHLMAEQNGASA